MEENEYITGGDCCAPVELPAPTFFRKKLPHGAVAYRPERFPLRLSIDHNNLRGVSANPMTDGFDRPVDDRLFAIHGDDDGDATFQISEDDPPINTS